VARGSVSCSVDHTDLVLMGTGKQLRLAAEKFKRQPFGIKSIADKLEQLLSGIDRKDFIVRCRSGALDLHRRTHIMGILNVTPDSFSDGGRYLDPEVALEMACRMVADGADIIDVGGESTRPGAKKVSADEEISRVIPVVERIAKSRDIPISIDTYKAMVAERALDCGADIINDISGLRFDGGMAAVAAEKGCPVVVMHIKGTPADMQKAPSYDSLMDEVIGSLQGSIDIATEAGVEPDNIIVDPGIGFGKRFEDNLGIIKNLGELKVLGKAVLAGASRKAFIGRILDGSDSEERLEGTLAASVIAAANGAHILRVHDVKEAKKAALVTDAIKGSS
jgi:dihydropteroate synthase